LAEVLRLEEVVADAAHVDAKFERVVVQNFGPVIYQVDIRFGAQPRNAGAITDKRVRKIGKVKPDLSRGVRQGGDVRSRNSECCCVRSSVVSRLSRIAKVSNADADLCKESWREDVIVGSPGAIGSLIASALESTLRRATEKCSKRRRLKGYYGLVTE
jgi:hypothetical protein